LRATLAAGLVSLLAALVCVGQTSGQEPSIRITLLECDSNPEVVFIENLGEASQDFDGWVLRSNPVSDPPQRFDLSVIGTLARGGRARIFSDGAAPSSDPPTGRFLWETSNKFRDDDPTDFVQVVNADGSVVDQLNCGEEAFLPTPEAAGQPQEQECDPSYPDVCLPVDADDYDCEGGSGDGPNYIVGPLQVLPPDPHDLDPDGDGLGCVAAPTSEVAGVAQSPAGPVAGFGPPAPEGVGARGWLVAGLAGAGLAWLVTGAAGLRLAARLAGPRPGNRWMLDSHGAGHRRWFVAARRELPKGPAIAPPRFKAGRERRS
jgi:hypothetical protein